MSRSRISRACGLALTLGLAAGMLSPARAQEIAVVVNGEQVAFDQPPIEQADRVFVPLRGVFERLGAVVDYSGGTIEADRGDIAVVLHVGSNVGYVNGYAVQLDVAPFIIGRRTLVPLRFISESLGASVDWSQEQQTVYIGLTTAVAPPPTGWQPPYPQTWPPPQGWWRPHGRLPRGWYQGPGGVWYPPGGYAPGGPGPGGYSGHGRRPGGYATPTSRPTFRPHPPFTPRPPFFTLHPYPTPTPRPTFRPHPPFTPRPPFFTLHPYPTPTPLRIYTPRPPFRTFHPHVTPTPTP
ncbi:MAG TPA: copper amine oxidase N-terminal domain-containing protein [Candidatus Tyrphobacter sp.]